MKIRTALACALACSVSTAPAAPSLAGSTTLPTRHVAKRMGPWGFDLTGMDTSVRPGDDFNAYASGNWAKRTAIPPDRSSFGAFAALREEAENALRTLIESLPASPAGTDRAKLADLYASYMNEAAAEERGIAPLQPLLDSLKAIADKPALTDWMGRTQGSFGGALVAARVQDDGKNPEFATLYITQSGLGLPDRDYYLLSKFAPQKAEYERYVARMLSMAGWPDAEAAASGIVAFETKIADAHWTRADSRDRSKTYNPMTPAAMADFAPGFDWQRFLSAAGVGAAPKFVVAQNTAMPKLAKLYGEAPLDLLKAWQAFKLIDDAAPLLSSRFADANFEFRTKFLTGVPQQRERAKRAVAFVESSMGEALGREYVAEYFPPESKAKMEALVADIKTAMKGRIERLEWMTPETKRNALAKLAIFQVKIGYPVKWRDYTGLEVARDDLFGNALRARKFAYEFQIAKLGKRIDREEWGMTPQTVNAYYSSTRNEIVFPAAILQPPFFDPEADPAVNYGAIGGVIGHEITHGFDDQGRKSDDKGILRDWWTLEDARKFEAQAFRLGTQYESFEFAQLPNFRIVGRLTMGENIADLGGVLLALDAYRLHLARTGQPAPVLDGFTGDQRVFLGWAQVWRTLARDASLRQQLATDPHSPGAVRAFAPLRNIDAWYEAFNIQPTDKNYLKPEDRVRIW